MKTHHKPAWPSADWFLHPKISTRYKHYGLLADGVETVVGITLDVVIVGSNPRVSKSWYEKAAYDPDTERPDCTSANGIAPDPDSAKPFHANCAECPNNRPDSMITPSGANDKICSDQRHLAVMPSADPTKVYRLTVNEPDIKGLRAYMRDLGNLGLVAGTVVTALSFDQPGSVRLVIFKQNGCVPDKALGAVAQICASGEVLAATRQKTPPPRQRSTHRNPRAADKT